VHNINVSGIPPLFFGPYSFCNIYVTKVLYTVISINERKNFNLQPGVPESLITNTINFENKWEITFSACSAEVIQEWMFVHDHIQGVSVMSLKPRNFLNRYEINF